MKKLMLLVPALLFAFVLMAQPPKGPANKGMVFGAPTTADGAISTDQIDKALENADASADVKVMGKIVDVCKAEGCWIKMETAKGPMMIKMKDHAFLVPVSLNGKNVVVAGSLLRSETSVEMLRHYAEDAGKSKAEIEAITAPKVEITMQAKGILVM